MGGPITPWALAESLESSLGREAARDLVAAACRDLSLSGRSQLTTEEAARVLDQIGLAPGLVAVAARLAKGRLIGSAGQRAPAPRPLVTESVPRIPVLNVVSRPLLVGMLSASLGLDVANEAITVVAQRLGITSEDPSAVDCHRILEELARAPGVMGTIARRAQGRLAGSRPAETVIPDSVTTGSFIEREELVDMLSEGTPRQGAKDALDRVLSELLFHDDIIPQAIAMQALSVLSERGGAVGVNATLVKTRLNARLLRARIKI